MAVNEPSSTDNFVQIEDRVINKVADATDTTDNITLDDRVFIFKENESKQIEKVCNAKVSWLVDKFAEEATKAKNDAITAKNDAVSAQQASESARDRSKEWANKAEDSVVADSEYSALHYMKKAKEAEAQAEAIKNQMQQTLNNAVEEVISTISLSMHPVGSYYLSENATSPASLFGGTWEQIKDRFLVGAGNSYGVGDTGGSSTHTLSTAEMPKHSHTRGTMNITGKIWGDMIRRDNNVSRSGAFELDNTLKGNISSPNGGYSGVSTGIGFNASNNWTGSTSEAGSNSSFNIMNPYRAVYMWKRIS